MFRFLGRFASRGWLLIFAAWVGLFFGLRYAAPTWNAVAAKGQFNFLPPESPTRRSERLLDRAFPDDQVESSIVIVAHREREEKLRQEGLKFINERLVPELRNFELRTGRGHPVHA